VPCRPRCALRHSILEAPRPDIHCVFPVQPPSLADYTQGHHDYPATDIFAPEGSSFVAVTNGMVEEVSETDRWTQR
jgi:peptidoglycan LD-endopeptidase LytH